GDKLVGKWRARQESQRVVGALQRPQLTAGGKDRVDFAALQRLAHGRADGGGHELDVRVLQAAGLEHPGDVVLRGAVERRDTDLGPLELGQLRDLGAWHDHPLVLRAVLHVVHRVGLNRLSGGRVQQGRLVTVDGQVDLAGDQQCVGLLYATEEDRVDVILGEEAQVLADPREWVRGVAEGWPEGNRDRGGLLAARRTGSP